MNHRFMVAGWRQWQGMPVEEKVLQTPQVPLVAHSSVFDNSFGSRIQTTEHRYAWFARDPAMAQVLASSLSALVYIPRLKPMSGHDMLSRQCCIKRDSCSWQLSSVWRKVGYFNDEATSPATSSSSSSSRQGNYRVVTDSVVRCFSIVQINDRKCNGL